MKWIQLHKGVSLGPGSDMEDFVVVGVPPQGHRNGELSTVIGSDSKIRSHTTIYAGNKIGNKFQTGHGVLIREKNVIGDEVSIGSGTILEHDIQIGDRVRIHSNAFVPEFTVLEDDCWLGPHVVVTNARFPMSSQSKIRLKGVLICRGAKIGANATLLPGVVIGEGAVVGAGSVVTHDIPPFRVFAGNPARDIKGVQDLRYEEDPTVLVYDTPR